MSTALATLNRFDCEALEWVTRRRSRGLIAVMRGFSFSGNASTVALAFAAILYLWPTDDWLRAGVAALLGLAVFFVLKRSVKRSRPRASVIAAPDPFSLPSGHATCAWAIAFSLLLGAPPAVSLPAVGWATVVSLSRVILGVHYPLDIVAGGLLGSLAALLVRVWM